MFSQFQRTRLAGAVLIGALMLTLWFRIRHIHHEQERPLGHLTAQRVIQLAEPLCRRIVPETSGFQFSAEANQGVHRSWEVACRDGKGHEIAALKWDAPTDKLSEVSVWPLHSQDEYRTPLSEQEACAKMRSWLRLVRPDISSKWRPVGKFFFDNRRNQALEWVSQDIHAFTKVNAYSGRLVLVWFWHSSGRPTGGS